MCSSVVSCFLLLASCFLFFLSWAFFCLLICIFVFLAFDWCVLFFPILVSSLFPGSLSRVSFFSFFFFWAFFFLPLLCCFFRVSCFSFSTMFTVSVVFSLVVSVCCLSLICFLFFVLCFLFSCFLPLASCFVLVFVVSDWYVFVYFPSLFLGNAPRQSLVPNADMSWTSDIEPLLEYYTERTPGAVIEVSTVVSGRRFTHFGVSFFDAEGCFRRSFSLRTRCAFVIGNVHASIEIGSYTVGFENIFYKKRKRRQGQLRVRCICSTPIERDVVQYLCVRKRREGRVYANVVLLERVQIYIFVGFVRLFSFFFFLLLFYAPFFFLLLFF